VQALGREIVVKPALPHDGLTAIRTGPALHPPYRIDDSDHPSYDNDEKGIFELSRPEEEVRNEQNPREKSPDEPVANKAPTFQPGQSEIAFTHDVAIVNDNRSSHSA
jgi:hypothetical protein